MIKALVPTVYTDVCDRAMQVFGAAGLAIRRSPTTGPGAARCASPTADEVHLQAIARMEIRTASRVRRPRT